MPAKIDFSKNKAIEKKILSRIPPQKIADDEKVSIAHVHNVKNDMENRGVKVPEIKKGRPTAAKKSGDPNVSIQAITGSTNSIKENLRNKKKGVSINIDSFPQVPIQLQISSKEVIVYYGDTSKKITF